ncbi:MAG: hypothetical protein A2979_00020 [Deltaproteobacteria bacterium RIFCSPLOWO2_01_FULL_45_74]|nr:MAG: hypothetical protein A2712_04765 [Deltaproteobacteria bacterium RIFCSPHIGHO2_01_FULL_43_49]OGQ15350.1 MAG: hypothetical protein A3D22_07830 [Deltaproteobacteria bacterium RIFCSPHIGHO2_02_FULL_44_53]OGQ31460.1 MAG: hypothetical protein A2979_00020 [Deltaproteobacteria bacterium RIFCSPLOWO2_01_FULL_45_74]OGQ42707.1 MAG: hypothetical protein A3I70_03915 [Deltaproteobacteria bacterium RIFCSPLOWO2_02_FULL_44_34]
MYKKLCAFIVMIAFLGSTSFAAVYDAECLNTKGKMAECKVAISNNTVSIQSKRKRDAELNRTIAGQKISKITEGEYARRRVGEAVAGSIVFLPLALFVFAKKKKDQFGIEYTDENGQAGAALISVKKKYGIPLARELNSISGLEIVFDDSGKKKISKKELKRRDLMNQPMEATAGSVQNK